MRTLGELREFIKDLPDDLEVVAEYHVIGIGNGSFFLKCGKFYPDIKPGLRGEEPRAEQPLEAYFTPEFIEAIKYNMIGFV